MEDLDLVIDGTTVNVHFTEGGKMKIGFPEESNATATLDGGEAAPSYQGVERVAAAILGAFRSCGYLRPRPTNPQHPEARQVDPIQGYASN